MTYRSILVKVPLILLGFLSVVSSAENASSQEKPLAQTKRIIPTCQDNLSTSGNRVVPTLPQQFRSPSARTKLPFVRGGSERSLVASTESGDDAKTPFFSRGVESVRVSKRRWKRKEMFALFLLRIGFLINLPFSILFLALSLVFWSLTIIVRILTLNFVARDLSSIAYALSKALVALTFASLTGIFLPVFAMFGLIASLTGAAIEIAEPILRIRYRRILRKLRHLQKILNDPVLLETIDIMSRGAQAVTAATSNQVQNVSRRAVRAGKLKYDGVQDTSAQLIETLIQSPSAIAWQESVKKRLPDSVAIWTRDQVNLLRNSGVLEEAASHALNALSKSKELSAAATLLPYIEAISQVQKDLLNAKR